jgi:hypothetical protein
MPAYIPCRGDNLVINPKRGTRFCRACWKAKHERPMTDEELNAVKQAALNGWTINKITMGTPVGGGAPDRSKKIVHSGILFAQCKRDPDFAQFLKECTKDNNKRGQKLRWTRVHSATVRDDNNEYYKIRGMIPEGNPHRDDIVARIFEDMLSGALMREEVPVRVKVYIAEFNRLFPTKYAKFGNSPLVSLDEVLFEHGTATRGENAFRSLWD